MAVTPIHDHGEQARTFTSRLKALLDEGQSIDLTSLTVDALDALGVGLLHVGAQTSALTATVIAEADAAGLAAHRGVRSLNAHLAAETHAPTSQIAPFRTAGLWLGRFPVFTTAALAGELTSAHIWELRQLDNPRTHLALQRDQEILRDAALTLDFKDWLDALAYWLLHADPDGPEPKERNNRYGMAVRKKRDGDIDITLRLDPLTGEAFTTAVEHEAQKLFRNERDAGHTEGLMPHNQRRVIALMRLLSRGFERKDGTHPVPLVNIVMSEGVLEDLIQRMLGEPIHDFDPLELAIEFGEVDRRCETIQGTPLDPRRAWPAVLIGRLRRQILDARSGVMHSSAGSKPTTKSPSATADQPTWRTAPSGVAATTFAKAAAENLLFGSRGRTIVRNV
ncbi:MAG: hypothetical protein ACR2P0_06425 [Acidimicrobiales bacterium]